MSRIDAFCYWVSLSSAILLFPGPNAASSQERPVHTLVIALATCAFALVSVSKALPVLFGIGKFKPTYTAVPLDDLEPNRPQDRPIISAKASHGGRVRLTVLATACIALSLRVELYRRISKAPECARNSVEIFLPLLVGVYDALRFQQIDHSPIVDGPDGSIYDVIKARARRHILRPRSRYICSVTLVCLGCDLLLDLWQPLNSTYICPLATNEQTTVQLCQLGSLILDAVLAIVVCENLPRSDGTGLTPRRSVVLWSSTMAASAVVWSVVGLAVYTFKPEWRFWLLLFDTPSFLGSVLTIFKHAVLFCIFCIATLHCIMAYGTLAMTLVLTAVMTAIPSIMFIWTQRDPFPTTPTLMTTTALLSLYIGWSSFHTIQKSTGAQENGPIRPKLVFFVITILVFPAWIKHNDMYYHPIDLLIYDASLQNEAYVNATVNDGSLVGAVSRYREKYNINPPPGFDVWFEYAMNRSTLIIDEYDQIYEDVLPFFAIEPEAIRRSTWEVVANPWNEISGIMIRDGVASLQENVIPTHRWMLEGVAILINSFARYLPDMDIAFNLNDESRINLRYEHLEQLRTQAISTPFSGSSPYSSNRSEGWLAVPKTPEEEYHDSHFIGHSFRNTFAEFGSVGCSPSSAARRTAQAPSRSHICTSCTAPHTMGQFTSNWSLSASPCHQPDLSYLHGFYLSPAAFKASYTLLPVFSQSKPHGYNDILYPSAWNYMDKVIYAPSDEPTGEPGTDNYNPAHPDPIYSLKQRTLFWRGATSEGVSSGDATWRGMTRQRLVHLTNNLTSHPHDSQSLLLPHPSNPGRYTYLPISGSSITTLNLDTDVKIVDHIARCGGIGLHDCTDQDVEFAPRFVHPSDFQEHWRYKYLFDLDGAGFSGRFLPFLQSNSLPFKTAVFREWWDSRVTAWRHFVPIDIRLHGVYSTLAYFAGVDGYVGGKVVQEEETDEFGQVVKERVVRGGRRLEWEGHEREGEMIAREGQAWAGKVLRKEDMEVYFFRLLLEWGRVTDDNRENLGFVMPERSDLA